MFVWFPVTMVMQLPVAMIMSRISRGGGTVGLHLEGLLCGNGGGRFNRMILMFSSILVGMCATTLLFCTTTGANTNTDE